MLSTIQKFRSVLEQLLPPEIKATANRIAVKPDSFDYPEEGKHLKNAVQVRRNEFITGRRCARSALAQLGATSQALPPDEDRIPKWPPGFVASISHCRGICCAVAASKDQVRGLGVDLEQTKRMSSGVMKRIVHPLEANFAGADQILCSLLFSAKEAFFKAQFPIWGAWPNFEDLALQPDASKKQLTVIDIATHLPESLRSTAPKMRFRYAFIEDYVVTLCWLDTERETLRSSEW